MDRDHLNRLIEDPARVQGEDIADLRTMAERYPWFSGAHLLMAVGGHREGDVLFDEQLRVSAAHLPSRSALYDHLQVPQNQAFDTYAAPPITPALAPPLPTAPAEVIRETFTVPAAPIDATAVPAPVDVPAPDPPVFPLEAALPAAFEEAPTTEVPEADPLDKLVRNAALVSSYELLLEHSQETPRITPDPEPPAFEVAPPPTPQAPSLPVLTHRRFTEWLSAADVEASTPQVPARLGQHAPAVATLDHEPAEQRGTFAQAPASPADTKALIDRFIQQSTPAAPVRKAEFFTPQQAAKRSLEDHADLVSETLARIYEKQGNTAKAIAAYERLAVKHPEKAAYFRSLGKALEGR